jgi:hypothetical protein
MAQLIVYLSVNASFLAMLAGLRWVASRTHGRETRAAG